MPIVVTVNRPALMAMGQQPAGSITRHWLRLMANVDRIAKAKLTNDVVHVNTGNLRSSQQAPLITHRGDVIVGVATNIAEYAMYVHEGTRAHEIRPRRGKFLTGWQHEGATVFTKVVKHPGTKPRPWLREAVEETMRTLG